MSLRWYSVVVDCHDLAAQARWWAETLDYVIVFENEDLHELDVFILLDLSRLQARYEKRFITPRPEITHGVMPAFV